MAQFEPFDLVVEVSTLPEKHLAKIADSFDRAYKGERGNIEDQNEFFLRKVEEYITSIHRRMYVEDRTLGQQRDLEKEATAGMRIRKQLNKPEVINELGENDSTMMPADPVMATTSKSKSKRGR